MGNVPVIPTLASGAVVTSAHMNTIKAADDFWANTPRCLAYPTGTQTFTTGVYAPLALGAEVYDIVQSGDAPMHDNTTNNSRIFIRTPGKYEISAQILWDVNTTGSRSLQIRKNAAGSISGGTQVMVTNNSTIATFATAVQSPVWEEEFSAGDYVEMFGFQNSGGNLTTSVSPSAPRATFLRVKLTGS